MKAMVGLEALQPAERGAAITIGTFDGLHLGHRSLIAQTIELGRGRNLESTVVTWDRHPFVTLRPGRVPPLLTSQGRRVELIEGTGADTLIVLPFDKELSSWSPERFATEVLAKKLGARTVVVGHGWRFGRGATGDVPLLKRLGDDLGFDVVAASLTTVAGDAASSSRARAAVAAGEMELARALLARPFDMDGIVVRGAGRGADLGYPTANLAVDPALVMPARGAYAGRARASGLWYPAAISVGVAPTFGGDSAVTVEAYLLDFEADLYGESLRVEFWKHLHDDLAFETVPELIRQIDADVEATQSVLGAGGEPDTPSAPDLLI
jgi:riboflavin kinase / FMN adenylyltransferase